jgi:hypothetical protein
MDWVVSALREADRQSCLGRYRKEPIRCNIATVQSWRSGLEKAHVRPSSSLGAQDDFSVVGQRGCSHDSKGRTEPLPLRGKQPHRTPRASIDGQRWVSIRWCASSRPSAPEAPFVEDGPSTRPNDRPRDDGSNTRRCWPGQELVRRTRRSFRGSQLATVRFRSPL